MRGCRRGGRGRDGWAFRMGCHVIQRRILGAEVTVPSEIALPSASGPSAMLPSRVIGAVSSIAAESSDVSGGSAAQVTAGTNDQTRTKLKMMERNARLRTARGALLGRMGLSAHADTPTSRAIVQWAGIPTLPRLKCLVRNHHPCGSKAIRDSTPHQLIRFLVERGILTPIPLSRTTSCSPTGAMPRAAPSRPMRQV